MESSTIRSESIISVDTDRIQINKRNVNISQPRYAIANFFFRISFTSGVQNVPFVQSKNITYSNYDHIDSTQQTAFVTLPINEWHSTIIPNYYVPYREINNFYTLESLKPTRIAVGFTNQDEVTKRMSFISLDTSSAWRISNDGQTIDTGDNAALLGKRRHHHHAELEEEDVDNNGNISRKGLPNYIYDFLTKQTLYESSSSENSDNE